MIKKIVSLTLSWLLIFSNQLFSQEASSTGGKSIKQFVGVQMNPYLFSLSDIGYLRYNYKVFCLRYGVEVTKGLYLGSQYFFIGGTNDFFQLENRTMNLGIFSRYDLVAGENIGLLLETAFHYRCDKYKYLNLDDSGKKDGVGWYASTGMGINLYKKKVTLDLMVKYSPDVLFEGYHFVPTYKLNYHFK